MEKNNRNATQGGHGTGMITGGKKNANNMTDSKAIVKDRKGPMRSRSVHRQFTLPR